MTSHVDGGPGNDHDDPEKRVSARLRELRRERGLTLTTLAEWTGISAAHLSRMEKGGRQPSIGSLIQLARACAYRWGNWSVTSDRKSTMSCGATPHPCIRAPMGPSRR